MPSTIYCFLILQPTVYLFVILRNGLKVRLQSIIAIKTYGNKLWKFTKLRIISLNHWNKQLPTSDVAGSVCPAGIVTELLALVKLEAGICWEFKLLRLLIAMLVCLANEWTMTRREITNRTPSLQDINKQGISFSLKVTPSLKTNGNALSQTLHLEWNGFLFFQEVRA
jgi:hypothetical protein